jgi:hypothetical protein
MPALEGRRNVGFGIGVAVFTQALAGAAPCGTRPSP